MRILCRATYSFRHVLLYFHYWYFSFDIIYIGFQLLSFPLGHSLSFPSFTHIRITYLILLLLISFLRYANCFMLKISLGMDHWGLYFRSPFTLKRLIHCSQSILFDISLSHYIFIYELIRGLYFAFAISLLQEEQYKLTRKVAKSIYLIITHMLQPLPLASIFIDYSDASPFDIPPWFSRPLYKPPAFHRLFFSGYIGTGKAKFRVEPAFVILIILI